jgi:hypothetical protein
MNKPLIKGNRHWRGQDALVFVAKAMLIHGNSFVDLQDKGDNKARMVILVDFIVILAAYEGLVGNGLDE